MMAQESAEILGYCLFLNVEVDQTIALVTQATIIEISVAREEGGSVQLMQQRYYFVVFHAFSPKVLANLPEGDAPAPQQHSLTLRDVLIQDIHAGLDSWAYSAA